MKIRSAQRNKDKISNLCGGFGNKAHINIEHESIVRDIEHSVSTLKTIDRLRYAAIPITALSAIASPGVFATVAGISAVTLGIGAWKATRERKKLLGHIKMLNNDKVVINKATLDKFVSTANRIAVGGSIG